MGGTRKPRVLVLYVHPLLGQGLARLLSAQAGVRATAVAACDSSARESAIRRHPDLIIAEETSEAPAVEATESLPVVFVRIDLEDGERSGHPLADPELIIALARGLAQPPVDLRRPARRAHAHSGTH